MNKEELVNLPNALTLLRILICFVIIYLILNDYNFKTIIIIFTLGMLTDFFDGFTARRFNKVTEFGRKFDMIADRVFMVGVALTLTIHLSSKGALNSWHISQIILILSREIISLPFAILTFFSGKTLVPNVRFIGKLTTFMQAIAFPLIILNVYYPRFQFSIYVVIITSIIGTISGIRYGMDLRKSK